MTRRVCLAQPCARELADASGSLVAADIASMDLESPCSIVFQYSIGVSMYVWFVWHWFVLHSCFSRLELGRDQLSTLRRYLPWTEVTLICAVHNT